MLQCEQIKCDEQKEEIGMEKIIKRIVAFTLVLALVIINIPATNVDAASKPAKVKVLTLTRASKTSISVEWAPVRNVKGYVVYMKKGKSGSFKKIKTTKSSKCTATKLTMGENYYFKVRAYKIVKKKTVYGSYSLTAKLNLAESVYLADVLSPYAGGAYTIYNSNSASSFEMGGIEYTNGFTMNTDSRDVHDLYFNLKGEYKTMTFEWGCVDGREDEDTSTIMIYEDDTLVDTLTRNKNDLTKSYKLDVSDVYKLRIVRSEGWNAGFANVKLFY